MILVRFGFRARTTKIKLVREKKKKKKNKQQHLHERQIHGRWILNVAHDHGRHAQHETAQYLLVVVAASRVGESDEAA